MSTENRFRAKRRDWRWPKGEKIAFTVGLAFEAFDFQSQYRTRDTPGKINVLSLSYAEYGVKVGGWRLLELFDKYGVKAHIATNGLAAERYPEFLAMAAAEGHEPVGHGWVNDRIFTSEDIDRERADIERVAAAIEAATGARPLGWSSPGAAPTLNTYSLLCDLGYTWCADDASDELPFYKPVKDSSLLILPQTNAPYNDVQVWLNPRNPPSIIWEGFKDAFDCLHAEGSDGTPGWIELLLHCHVGGRPVLGPTIKKCIEYALGHDGVWLTSRNQIASWASSYLKSSAPPIRE